MVNQYILYVVMAFSGVFISGMVAMSYYCSCVVNSIARNPSAANDIKAVYLILGSFIEAGMLFGLIICLILLFAVK
jgi:F0F1-type ATP synthase membrane subunit c/vacuolar-type H+-ATPase subunit K